MMTLEQLRGEVGLLALKLAMNNTIALQRAGLLSPDLGDYCAAELKRVAGMVDQATNPETLPPRLAQDLHALAAHIQPRT